MSESDSFIREVSEEVRQDEMARAWGRYKFVILGVAAAAVAAVSLWTWVQHRAEQAALAAGTALLEAEAPEALAALADTLDGGPGVLAGLRAAAALADSDPAAAAARYRALAALPDLDPAYADLAALAALRVQAAAMEPAAFQAEIAPLVADGRPYRLLALELRAALALNGGEAAAARADLDTILADPAATGATRSRAQAVLDTMTTAP